MSVSPAEVRNVAALARLRFTPDEEAQLADELSRILEYVDQLRRVDLGGSGGIEPQSGPEPVLRDDVVQNRLSRDEALANAPDADGQFFRVPTVIE